MNATIHIPTEAENAAALNEFFQRQRKLRQDQVAACAAAKLALPKLMEAMRCRSGQSYHLRALLYSLWNGKDTSLSKVLSLDAELRTALLAVVQAFGSPEFFYDELTEALREARLFEWFIAEGGE